MRYYCGVGGGGGGGGGWGGGWGGGGYNFELHCKSKSFLIP